MRNGFCTIIIDPCVISIARKLAVYFHPFCVVAVRVVSDKETLLYH